MSPESQVPLKTKTKQCGVHKDEEKGRAGGGWLGKEGIKGGKEVLKRWDQVRKEGMGAGGGGETMS